MSDNAVRGWCNAGKHKSCEGVTGKKTISGPKYCLCWCHKNNRKQK